MTQGSGAQDPKRLLVCTVGGSEAPVITSFRRWRPRHTVFICTDETTSTVKEVVGSLRQAGEDLDRDRYDVVPLRDGQDLLRCLDDLSPIRNQVDRWVRKGSDFEVVVDITGGTKCMTAALALHASRWKCTFSYVGGRERTRGGTGTVVDGSEYIVYASNPWNALGYQAVEDFVILFDQHAFSAAVEVAQRAKTRVDDPTRRNELNTLEHLARGYDAWDRFDHQNALHWFEQVRKGFNNLKPLFGEDVVRDLKKQLDAAVQLLKRLKGQVPSRDHVIDLLANAGRRRDEGRHDDAVARLYRAVEAIGQVTLRVQYDVDTTAAVRLETVPKPLRSEWKSRADNGTLKLGLQDTFRLLQALERASAARHGDGQEPAAGGDAASAAGGDVLLGQYFAKLGLDGEASPLTARNASILAHGFTQVGEKVCAALWEKALALVGVTEADLPKFPTLTPPPPG